MPFPAGNTVVDNALRGLCGSLMGVIPACHLVFLFPQERSYGAMLLMSSEEVRWDTTRTSKHFITTQWAVSYRNNLEGCKVSYLVIPGPSMSRKLGNKVAPCARNPHNLVSPGCGTVLYQLEERYSTQTRCDRL